MDDKKEVTELRSPAKPVVDQLAELKGQVEHLSRELAKRDEVIELLKGVIIQKEVDMFRAKMTVSKGRAQSGN